jgi:hypothetical protein
VEDKDIDKLRTNLLLASVAVIFLFGGLASFSNKIDLPVLGVKINNPKIFPWLLVSVWLYFWQRFTSLSSERYAAELQSKLSAHFNTKDLVRRIFPPAKYGIIGECTVVTRAWLPETEEKALGPSRVIYRHHVLSRVFEFSYHSAQRHVHFLDPKITQSSAAIKSGRISIQSIRYWQCLLHEALLLIGHIQKWPLVMYYYFPRAVALSASTSLFWWGLQQCRT